MAAMNESFLFSVFQHLCIACLKSGHKNNTTKVRLRTVINAGHCSVQRIKCKHFGHVTLADVGSGQIKISMSEKIYTERL